MGAVVRISRGGKDTSRMISLGLLLIGLVLVQAGHHNHVLSDHFIEKINSANSTWRAGRNFHPETSHNFLRTLMGVHPMAHKHLPPAKPTLLGGEGVPENFDPREKWPECPTIRETETREVADPAGLLVPSLPCRIESASTLRGNSMCTCPARTCSPAATLVDLDATVASPEQPGVSGPARDLSVVVSMGPTRVANPMRLSPVSTMSTEQGALARREVALQNVTRPARMPSSRFPTRRTRATGRRATQSGAMWDRSSWS